MLLAVQVIGNLLFILCQPVAVFLSALTLPGSVLVFASAFFYSLATGWQRPSWPTLAFLGALTLIAELADNLLAMAGVRQHGGRAATSLVAGLGGLAGGVIGASLGIPAALLGALLGGFAAAYAAERLAGTDAARAYRAGWGAVFGRLVGAVAKVVLTAVMSILALAVVYWPRG
jgi:uncharacterized protein YqgC (DUF456 family)